MQAVCRDEVLYLRLAGRLTFTAAGPLNRFLDGLAKGSMVAAVVDMVSADYVDSTILGILARLVRLVRERGKGRPVLYVAGADMDVLLDSVGFQTVFDIRHESPPPVPDYVDIESVAEPPPAADALLEAHRMLMDLNERNRAAFQDTVDALRRHLANEPTATTAAPRGP